MKNDKTSDSKIEQEANVTKIAKPKKNQSAVLQELILLLIKLMAIVLVFFLLEALVFGIMRYNAIDMEPALKEGDFIIFYRLDKRYRSGDLAVIDYEGKRQVQRVVAVGGDMVDITEDGLMINGHLQIEKNIQGLTEPYEEGTVFPVVLKEDEIFVLGDRREGATDSRLYGAVRTGDTAGKVLTVMRRRNF